MRLSTAGLSKVLGNAEIIRDINIAAQGNQFVGVIGPNGSGKSTLLKCLYRVLEPTSGAIMLDDKPLSQYAVKESARKISVVAQHNALSFDFTVLDVVMMGRAPHKRLLEPDGAADYDIARKALATVDMADFEQRSYNTLSGGEQQRVIVARALAQETPCLILDEPTNHMDIKYQLQLMSLVKSLNITVVTAIHDLNIAAMYCDHLYVLKDGNIVAAGVPREILTEALIREVYEVQATLLTDAEGFMHVLYSPA